VAIFHASTKPIARSAGRSSVAAAAYRAGCELVDERTGLIHDYTQKGGIVSTEILTPDGLGAERNALWNAAEQAEKRKDARTAREWIVALPVELNSEQRHALARSFGVKLVERFEVAVDIAIHQPDREGDNRNHHAHILTTTRQVSRAPTGALVMGKKAAIELSDKARRDRGLSNAADEISAIRRLWEQTANQALARAGRPERIDARSLKAQGIDREATTHLGPAATEMERRGAASDRGNSNRQAAAHNQERARLSAQIIDLQSERQRREAQEKPVAAVLPRLPSETVEQAAERLRKGYIAEEKAKAVEARAKAYEAEATQAAKAYRTLEQNGPGKKPLLRGREAWERKNSQWLDAKRQAAWDYRRAMDAAQSVWDGQAIGMSEEREAVARALSRFAQDHPALKEALNKQAERERQALREKLEHQKQRKLQMRRGKGLER
jgi:hypothetical protein